MLEVNLEEIVGNSNAGIGEISATAIKEMISTVKVGRRGCSGGATSTTTETKIKTTTTKTIKIGK